MLYKAILQLLNLKILLDGRRDNDVELLNNLIDKPKSQDLLDSQDLLFSNNMKFGNNRELIIIGRKMIIQQPS